ncbi:S41 family peptidase [Chlamydiifrater volucris]|uniref:tail-specific protease Tsp n=1 Tax=Chlamydiifrater volucris TaxID=2681470 RepID=UPI001BCE8207|nr:S41 family peptidase [Chlamydiifrater volucris]
MNRIIRSFFVFLWIFPRLCLSTSTLLTEEIVKKTADQLAQYHVDNKEISPLVLARSLACYMKTFDMNKVYLTEKEWKSSTQSLDIKKNLAYNYKNHNFSVYQKINDTIKESIFRARSWRCEWRKNPVELVNKAKEIYSFEKYEEFSPSIQTLKTRHLNFFLSYLSAYLEESKENRYAGKEELLVLLCEKQLTNYENDYLGINEYGNQMPEEEEKHYILVRALKSIANSLDAHTAYFSKEEALAMRIQLEKGMCGIGVVLREDIFGITIREIIPGGPAEISKKLSPGDVIQSVNGQSIEGISFKGVLEILRGNEGSSVTLGVMKEDGTLESVHLTRSKIKLSDKRVDISEEPFGNGVIGKVTLHSFYEGEGLVSSENDLKKAISDLKKHNLLGLVLDIRENNGGFLSQAVKVAGLFMKNGVAVVSKYSDGSIKRYRTFSKTKFYDGPLVVLVSKGSASASEIVAQTLKDYGLAIVVGDQQTYGKGTIQHQTVTGNRDEESFFKVTIGKYYSPSGSSTQLEGVKSDIIIPSRYGEEKIGEKFLDNPLPADQCINVLEDDLLDLDAATKKWFRSYYLPDLQEREDTWRNMLPTLSENSSLRLSTNKNFQAFLKNIRKEGSKDSFGLNDIQMEESVNILKDMILIKQSQGN